MAKFTCLLTNVVVTDDPSTADRWKRALKFKSSEQNSKHVKKILSRYGVNNFDEYYDLIINGLKTKTIKKITDKYEFQREQEIEIEQQKEKTKLKSRILSSIKKISDNIYLRLLSENDVGEASKLYSLFQQTMGDVSDASEDFSKSVKLTDDFILKHRMIGLFIDDRLAGFVIVDEKKRSIDLIPSKVETFYVQELLIHPDYRGKKYSKLLLDYCKFVCPEHLQYISLMTMPSNIPLIKVAESCGFQKQTKQSGDKKHSLLMIYYKDSVESKLSSS